MHNKPITSIRNIENGRPGRGDFFVMQPSKLLLGDQTIFNGLAPAWQKDIYCGEVVFNTGMTGYDQSLTDPSYAGQILVFTYPLIGNYGVSDADRWESSQIHAAGVVVSEACEQWSHSRSISSLLEWLHIQNVPIITGLDTRALTKHLRVHGTMLGAIGNNITAQEIKNAVIEPRFITIKKPIIYNPTQSKTVILVDCGMKNNILRSLVKLPVKIKRVPLSYDYTDEAYDGVVLSNGPGDPTDYPGVITITQKALKKGKPLFGICLGNQILGLAAGAKTYRLKFGHRGHNQPCISSESKCYITSQNHGYAIDEKTLPRNWKVGFRNLNDNSVEGIEHVSKPFFSVQFHPEASPGPTDTAWLFERFYNSL